MNSIRTSLSFSMGVAAFLNGSGVLAQSPDDGFRPNVNGQVHAMVARPDGKLIIVGNFSQVGGLPRRNVAQLHSDGRVDTNFVADVFAGDACPGCGWVSDVVLQHDRKILIGGYFVAVGALPRTNLARLNPDGSVDAQFVAGTAGSAPLGRIGVAALAIQDDGRILVGGGFTRLNELACTNLGRLNADGSVDAGFNPGADHEVLEITPVAGGRILIGGAFSQVGGLPRSNLARLRFDGAIETFGAPGVGGGPAGCFGPTWVSSLLVQPDGKVLIGGLFCSLNGEMRRSIARLNSDGTVDAAFDAGDTGLGTSNAPVNLALQPDGKILVGGDIDHLAGQPRSYLGRLNADGALDASFNPAADGRVHCFLTQADGKILVGGMFNTLAGVSRPGIGRLHLDGSPDRSLNIGTMGLFFPGGDVRAALLEPNGKIVIGGDFTTVGGQSRDHIARIQPSGEIDPLRNDVAASAVYGVILQRDHKLIGFGRNFVARWSEDGIWEIPYSVPVNGAVRCAALQPDGKLVLGGEFTAIGSEAHTRMARLNADGTADSTFNASAAGVWVMCVALQPDGKILVGGVFSNLTGEACTNLGRLNADGSVDASFTRSADSEVNCFAVQPDGKIMVGGRFSLLAGQPCNRIGRLNADGSFDGTFRSRAAGGAARVQTLALQADGRMLLHGDFTNATGQIVTGIVRLNPDGTLNEAFTPVGGPLNVNSLALQADGKVLVGSGFTSIGGLPRTNLARLSNPTSAIQHLSLDTAGRTVTWMRAGSAPEVAQVTFEHSADGTNYVLLGLASRASNGWTLAGLSLPAGEIMYLRARGRTAGGQFNGSSGLMESVARLWRLPPPFLSEVQVLGNGAFQFRFTETNATASTVLASTNAAAPVGSWEVLGTPVPLGGAIFQFTDLTAANHPRRFYQLRSP